MNYEDFATENGITLKARRTNRNPNMADSADMDHWFCTLKAGTHEAQDQRFFDLFFSKGKGHEGAEPTVEEALECLASDASSADLSFDEWCGEFGYDTDSRKALRTYDITQAQTAKLKALLGSTWDAFIACEA